MNDLKGRGSESWQNGPRKMRQDSERRQTKPTRFLLFNFLHRLGDEVSIGFNRDVAHF